MMIARRTCCILVVLLIATLSVQGFANASQTVASSPDFVRSASISIKVVLVGFDQTQIDTSYLAWSGSGKNLPNTITNMDLDSGNNTGVIFQPQYSFTFASNNFKQGLVGYLRSIEKKVHGVNPWFGQYQQDKQNPDYYVSVPLAIDYVVYDANSVENWLWNHGQDIGGYPEVGWTIIVAYLPELPSVSWSDVRDFKKTNGDTLPKSTPHYYGITHTDADLGYQSRYRDFMDGWGGHHRMWFVDFSAGPVYNSEWEDIPLQVALGDNNLDLSSAFGRSWITEYVADYVWQATRNFVVPDFVYSPQYAPNYQIDVFILDDRDASEKQSVPIQRTVNKEMVASAFKDLVPYSEVTVNLSYPEVTSQLHQLIKSNYKYTDSWINGNVFADPQRYAVVDVRPIYQYVLDNMASFERNPHMSQDTITIPVFAFAFSGETYFTYSYKWSIGKIDWETGALLGIALRECVLISYNQWEFTRGEQTDPRQPGKGDGFTQTIIHEVGHEFGLMHPHQYGNIGDFILSAMGYFTEDYEFGQIDKDALQRAHVDQIYKQTQRLISYAGESSDAAEARRKLVEVDSAYAKMQYATAIQPALQAYKLVQKYDQTPSTSQVTPTGTPTQLPFYLYLVGGLAIGLVVAAMVFLAMNMQVARIRRGREPSGTRAYEVTTRRCSSCGNQIKPQDLYCVNCGAKRK